MNYRFSDEIAKHYAVLWKATDNVFTMRESLSEAKSSITAFYNVGIQNCTYLAEGNEDIIIAGQIVEIMEKLKELANQKSSFIWITKSRGKLSDYHGILWNLPMWWNIEI